MRILMVTNKVRMYALGFSNVIETLQNLGHSVVWAANFSYFKDDLSSLPCEWRDIPINTNPLSPDNIKAYRRLLKIMHDDQIEAVMCSTPIGGMLARMAAKQKKITPVIYEAHGFLFFKGAPLINRTLFKWEESLLAHWTDVLITITQEDYRRAQSFSLRRPDSLYYVHGAGVEVGVEVEVSREQKRKELGIAPDAFLLVSAGELNKNKNIAVVIQAIAQSRHSNVIYVLCGEGPEQAALESLATSLGVRNQILFLGFRLDVAEILASADAFVISSFREGVPRALLEAMDQGLACIGSQTRGINDLIHEGQGGFLCNPHSSQDFQVALDSLVEDSDLRATMGAYNKAQVQNYSVAVVKGELHDIFTRELVSNPGEQQ